MTLVWTESFDLANTVATSRWSTNGAPGATGSVSYVTGRAGTGNALSIAQGNSSGYGVITTLIGVVGGSVVTINYGPTVIIGFGWEWGGAGTSQTIISLMDAGTIQMGLTVDSTGKLAVTKNGVTQATETNAMGPSTWYYIEFKVTIATGAGGSWSVRRNGSTIPGLSDTTGVATQVSANAYINTIRLGVGFGATNPPSMVYDDMYLCNDAGSVNNDFLGDVRVIGELPSAAGTNTSLTKVGASATNWQSVSENPPNSDTTYVASSVPGTYDTYNYPDLPSTAMSVLAVNQTFVARKDDTGTRALTAHVRSGGSEAEPGASIPLATTYRTVQQVMETNPVTGVAWTPAVFNAAEIGPSVAA